MKSTLALISTIAALAAFPAAGQTGGSGGGTGGGSAAGGSTPGTTPGMRTPAGNAAGNAGTVIDRTGNQTGAGQRGFDAATPGAPGTVGSGTASPTPGAVPGANQPAGTVDGSTPINPGLQVGPGFQTGQSTVPRTNPLGRGTGVGVITNQFGIGSNVLGIASNQFGNLSNQFGAMTNRFGGTNLLPTGRTNTFPRILHGNEPGDPVGGGATPPLPGGNP